MSSSAFKLLQAYRKLVDKFPYKVQTFTAGVLCTTGDAVTQMIEKQKNKGKEFNLRRSAVMATMGLGIVGPLCSVTLRYFHLYNLKPLTSVLIDQLATGPLIILAFVSIHPLLSGLEWGNIKKEMWPSLKQLIVSMWMVWVPVQLLNFNFIPYQFRVLFIQSVALFWNMFLSYRTNNTQQTIQQQTKQQLVPTTTTTDAEPTVS